MERIGRYRVLEQVGRGGSGAVYRANDPSGREVAVKLLLAGREATPLQRRRFSTEVQALLRVRHPHVVQLLDAGEEGGAPFLVMEWIAGETLAARLERGGPYPPRQAVDLICRLADALAACHRLDVLHRDLKPGNVLLRAGSGLPVLTDFGLAKDLNASASGSLAASLKGGWLGTPGYWPPEQARGALDQIGTASDVYGLGGLLFACLTAQPPQAGSTLVELIASFERPPTRPSELLASVPRALDDVCVRCLARDPADRYPGVDVVARDLQACLVARADGREEAPRSTPAAAEERSAQVTAAGRLALLLAAPLVGLSVGYLALRQPAAGPPPPAIARAGTEAPPPNPDPPVPAEEPGGPTPAQEFLRALAEAEGSPDPRRYRAALSRLLPLADAALSGTTGLERAELLVHRGVCLKRLQRLQEANRDLEEAARLDPLGDAGAEAIYQRALGSNPARSRVEVRGGGAWRDVLSALEAAVRNDFSRGRPAADRAVAAAPRLPQAHVMRAVCWLQGEGADLRLGQDALARALELDPFDAYAWEVKAELAGYQEHWDESRASFAALAELCPDDTHSLNQWALLEQTAGDLVAELRVLRRLAQLAPRSDASNRMIQLLLCDPATQEEGEQLLRQLEARNRADPGPSLIRFFAALERGDGQAALLALCRAAHTVPAGSELQQRLYWRVMDATGRLPREASRRALADAIRELPDEPAGAGERAFLEQARQFAGCATSDPEPLADYLAGLRAAATAQPDSCLLRGLELLTVAPLTGRPTPDLVSAFEADHGGTGCGQAVLTMYLLQQGERASARAHAERTRTLDPESGIARYALASLRWQEGDQAGARKLIQVALNSYFPDASWLQLAGQVERAQGDLKTAAQLFGMALSNDPLHPGLWKERIEALQALKRPRAAYAEATAYLARMKRLGAPLSLPNALALARLAASMGMRSEALGLLQALVTERALSADQRVEVAALLEQLGERALARDAVERALQSDPDHAAAMDLWQRLGRD